MGNGMLFESRERMDLERGAIGYITMNNITLRGWTL